MPVVIGWGGTAVETSLSVIGEEVCVLRSSSSRVVHFVLIDLIFCPIDLSLQACSGNLKPRHFMAKGEIPPPDPF